MTIFAKNEPLTEAELDDLEQILRNYSGGKAMNIEELDGFFSALIAGPDIVMPSEYLPEVLGTAMPQAHQFASLEETNKIMALLMRHWNDIAETLSKGDIYMPLLLVDENGTKHGNNWAHGFIRGTRMRHERWAELLADENHGGCMIPMLMLYHEHDSDPALRPSPIGPEQREKVIVSMVAGLTGAYRYFRQDQNDRGTKHGQKNIKIGRNDPCPCGSGKKYKRCCGAVTVH